jgi:hypothetical protein
MWGKNISKHGIVKMSNSQSVGRLIDYAGFTDENIVLIYLIFIFFLALRHGAQLKLG